MEVAVLDDISEFGIAYNHGGNGLGLLFVTGSKGSFNVTLASSAPPLSVKQGGRRRANPPQTT
jgi:hypothetical protein